jgi:hypothetical protein
MRALERQAADPEKASSPGAGVPFRASLDPGPARFRWPCLEVYAGAGLPFRDRCDIDIRPSRIDAKVTSQ